MSVVPDNSFHDSDAMNHMIDRALAGVDDAGSPEDDAAPTDWDLTAALIQRTLAATSTSANKQVPQAVIDRLRATAADQFATESAVEASGSVAPRYDQPRRSTLPSLFVAWAGWLAAAACLAIAVFAWMPRADPSLREQRAALIAQAPDAISVTLANPFGDQAAASASGDIVWSDARQAGYIRISGVQVNDPATNQYQLWIFREGSLANLETLEAHPVDGGVFNVASTGEVIIPIDAKIEVQEPTAFAITVEEPGGVVVSDRERIPLVGDAVVARSQA